MFFVKSGMQFFYIGEIKEWFIRTNIACIARRLVLLSALTD